MKKYIYKQKYKELCLMLESKSCSWRQCGEVAERAVESQSVVAGYVEMYL
jgi:hypothetical protein